MAVLVANQGQFTSLLHAFINFHRQFSLVFLLDGLNVLPSLILDLLSILLMILHHLLDLMGQGLLLSLQLLKLKRLVSAQLIHETLMGQVGLTHQVLELVQIMLFLLLELLIPILVGLTLLLLVTSLRFKHLPVRLHLVIDFLFVAPFHVTSLLLNLVHSLTTFCLLFFHFAPQIFSLLLILEHQGSLAFLPIPVLSLD